MTTSLKICFFLLISRGITFSLEEVCTNAYKGYPSGYVYNKDSVTRAEHPNANCTKFPASSATAGIHPENYIYCNGAQLKLTDSNLGSEQYGSSEYYVWAPGKLIKRQLLFIFPTSVNLTTIILHYYSDSERGLPGLKFFATPDDFNIWDAPTVCDRYAEVAAVLPNEEPAGNRNISVTFNVIMRKMLLVKLGSSFTFAVSEVEFLICNNTDITTEFVNQPMGKASSKKPTDPTLATQKVINATSSPGISDKPESTTSTNLIQANSHFQRESVFSGSATTYTSTTRLNYEITTVTVAVHSSAKAKTMLLTIGFVLATVTVVIAIFTVAIALGLFIRKSAQRRIKFESSYSTLHRETVQQSQHSPNNHYDQIQLSPLTGQAEVISKAETENSNSCSQNLPNNETEQSKAAISQFTFSIASLKQPEVNKSTDQQQTFAVARKKQKRDKQKESIAAEKEKESIQSNKHVVEKVEELYTAVQKKPKTSEAVGEDEAPSVPPHTVEELYTAVKKKPKCSAAEDTPQIPPHTVEELYTAVEKMSKDRALQGEEEAPPIPPHTVEDLYAAVQKKPKVAD